MDRSAPSDENQQDEHATGTPSTPEKKTICADFTALIAGDSYLNDPSLQDPAAREAVEAITDVLTNNLSITYFQRAETAVALLRNIGRTWTDEVKKHGPVEPFAFTRDWQIPITMRILTAFEDTFRGTLRQHALDWLRCECTDGHRAQLFWIGNTEDDLRRVHDGLHTRRAPQALLQNEIRKAIGNADVLDTANRACEALGPNNKKLQYTWTPGDYCTAYLVWAYVKGYEYAARLDNRYAYLTHFIRESAWAPKSAAHVTIANWKDLPTFPWGTFLISACTRDELRHKNAFADLTRDLGQYHAKHQEELERTVADLSPKTKTGDLNDRKNAYERAYKAAATHAANGIQHAHPQHALDLDQLWNTADLIATLAIAAKLALGTDVDASLALTTLKWEYRPQIDIVLSSTIHALRTRKLAAGFQRRQRDALAAYLASCGVKPPLAP